jgi:hypothetical protein
MDKKFAQPLEIVLRKRYCSVTDRAHRGVVLRLKAQNRDWFRR